eukprot:COSAG06_NODE_7126_length_2621_cov_4.756542_1_plen_107_part_00
MAVVTACTSIFTAWSAFSGTERKLQRYSNTIESVQSTMLWWRSLSSTDKALPAKIRQLVATCEEAFERERDSWASTSMSAQLLAAAAADDDEGEEGGRGKKGGKKP